LNFLNSFRFFDSSVDCAPIAQAWLSRSDIRQEVLCFPDQMQKNHILIEFGFSDRVVVLAPIRTSLIRVGPQSFASLALGIWDRMLL
jgi:hypothetical protein